MIAVTACDRKYFPGVLALQNSIKRNSPDLKLVCLTDDIELVEDLHFAGITPEKIYNSDFTNPLPTTDYWNWQSPCMYARLLAPKILEKEETILWLDADTLVLKQIPTPVLNSPCGGVVSWDYSLKSQIPDLPFPALYQVPALQAGTLVINTKVWNENNITDICFKLMGFSLNYKYVVQSVLNLALMGNFEQLDYRWNVFVANHETIPEDTLIAHYAGFNNIPWVDKGVRHADLWEHYYNLVP